MAADTLSTEDLRQEVEKLRLQVEQEERQRSKSSAPCLQSRPRVGTRILNYTNGDRYEGDTVDDMRHGEGRHKCSNGDEYNGRWQYDKRDGKGRAVFKRGVTYDGEWKEDKAHGFGICVYENGARYQGDFEDDKRCGWGLFEMPNGQTFEGEWERDIIHGSGRWTYEDGAYYVGSFSNGERIRGKFVSSDGDMEYEGEFSGGVREGRGIQNQKGHSLFTGNWLQDRRHGEGKCSYFDGSEYTGEWRNDYREGQGTMTSPAGYSYKGEWRRDKPHGKGVCRYENGDCYAGEFASGMREGEGRCLFANGEKYVGSWSKDQRDGKGKCRYPSGEKYKGEWKDNLRHGNGACVFSDGTAFRGQWDRDCWVQTCADPKFTIAAGAGLRKATAGRRACFQIEARDENNNRRLSGGDDLKVVLKNAKQELSFADVKDQEDGTYGASYVQTVSGDMQLCIVAGDGGMVGESPYSVAVSPGALSGKHSTVEGVGAKRAVCKEGAEFVLVIRDQFGNVCPQELDGSSLGLEVELTSTKGKLPILVHRQEDGCFRCSYCPSAPGLCRLAVMLRGKHIAGTPLSVAVSSASQKRCTQSARLSEEVVKDKVSLWGTIAREEYAKDGESDGWDSDAENDAETSESKFIKANPDVPVIENLEDLWKLSKLQQDRKRKGHDVPGHKS